MTRYALNPAMPVLSRPDGAVQVGWDPRRAVLVRPPSGLTAAALAELLRTLQSGATLAELQARPPTAPMRTASPTWSPRWSTPVW